MATKRYERESTDRDSSPAEPQYSDVTPSSAAGSSHQAARDADPNNEGGEGDGEIEAETIARRAYDRYRMRGEKHGHDQEDWYEAEREVRNERRMKPHTTKP
jgi:hypothetical protein